MLIFFITDYFGETVLKDNWNIHPSSEFTHNSGFINPVTSNMLGVHHNQTGKDMYNFEY